MKVLQIWSAFSSLAKLVIIGLVALLIGSFVLSFSKESALDRWKEGYEAYRDSAIAAVEWGREQELKADSALAFADSANAVADSLKQANEVIQAQTRAAARRNRQLAAKNDSLFAEVSSGAANVEEAVANTPEVIHPWVRLAFSLYEENSSLKQEIDLWKLQVDNFERRDTVRVETILALEDAVIFQTERADSLEAIILALPEGPSSEKLFGLIPLPSRKMSFIVGTTVGVITTAVILGQLK